MHPEVQRKAQAEIDRVVGSDRFPTFDDQVRLPYVDAVMREVLRWRPIGPLGKSVVHQSHGTVHPLISRDRLPITHQGSLTFAPRMIITRDIVGKTFTYSGVLLYILLIYLLVYLTERSFILSFISSLSISILSVGLSWIVESFIFAIPFASTQSFSFV